MALVLIGKTLYNKADTHRPVLQQNPNAPAAAQPTIVLPDFGRSWSADGEEKLIPGL